MNRRDVAIAITIILLSGLCAVGQSGNNPNQPSQTPVTNATVPLARDRFKNLKVLGDIPQSQWFGTMAFMAGSLGVKCEFCHKEGDFASDEKAEKQTARKMITMMRDLNTRYFEGAFTVTCNSCHRGSQRPVKTPDPEVQAFWRERPAQGEADSLRPSAASVLTAYRRALFGSETPTIPTLSATVREHAINGSGPPSDRVEHVYSAAPDKVRVEVEQPGGNVTFVCNGSQAWIKTVRGVTTSRCADLAQFTAAVVPDKLDIQIDPSALRTEQVGSELADVFSAITPEGKKVILYFGRTTGLLLRRRQFIETAFGAFPSDDDFSDFVAVAQLRLPNTVETKSVASHFMRTITERQVNLRLAESLFEKP